MDMPMTKEQFIERARLRSQKPGDYFDAIARIVEGAPGIGITDRAHYSQKQWAWLMQAKDQLWEPGD